MFIDKYVGYLLSTHPHGLSLSVANYSLSSCYTYVACFVFSCLYPLFIPASVSLCLYCGCCK